METSPRSDTVPLQPHRMTGGSAPSRCTVGLLTWNAGRDGAHCVASLLAQAEPGLQFLWIDNGSSDGTVESIRSRFPDLPAPLVNAANRGFCEPHNRMLARCETKYYLALNQDAVLAADYVRRLCDWMDENPAIAMASGILLRSGADPGRPSPQDVVESAGLVFPRARRQFHLETGKPRAAANAERRLVPGVEGAAMALRVEACNRVSLPGNAPFAESFFAYYEEIDLAQRLARAGLRCGVDGGAVAVHRGKGSGGFRKTAIRARFFANHWLAVLRNDPWSLMLRESPFWLRGELQFWLPEYLSAPLAFARAIAIALAEAPAARRFRRDFEKRFGPTLPGLMRCREESRKLLCAGKKRPSG